MAAITFSDPIDATNATDLITAAQALSSYVATYPSDGTFYNSSDYPTWKVALAAGVTAGNGLAVIQYGDRVFFIEFDPTTASVEAVQYGTNVILTETSV